MAAKLISFECTKDQGETLLAAIRLYAVAAYPPGGSECAQVARETLMDTANAIEQQLQTGKQVEVSRRLRSNIKAALEFYAETHPENDNPDRVLALKSLLSSKPGKTG